MKVNHLIIVGLMLLGFNLHAQQQFKGHIYDAQSQQALAAVSLKNTAFQLLTQSDARGAFSITGNGATIMVLVSLPGYQSQTVNLQSNGTDINIQLYPAAFNLSEVRVAGFLGHKANKETAGAIGFISANDIARGSGVSFQAAMNSIPGVRMEQSTLSEARISIRGNGVRSAYGMRSIKVYVNEIPVTEADGTTRIEALDVNSVGQAEIIKGPASSIYGAGTGGVINFQLQRAPYQEQSIELTSLAGAYGLKRLATNYRGGGDLLNSYVSYGWQEYEGYRAHSKDMRRFLTGNFQLFPSHKRMITLMLNRTNQDSQIPGSLTLAQATDNPIQANADNLDKKAARYQNWTRIGLGQQYHFNDKLTNNTSIFTYFYDLDHPLPYAYLHNTYQSYGGRTRFSYDAGFPILPTRFILGAEYNDGLTKGTQYVNVQGKEGVLNGNIDYKNTQYSLFYQSETNLGPKTLLTLGLSYNKLTYDVNNFLQQTQSGIKEFKPQANPRVALSHTFSETLSLHGSMSTGFSPPSSAEIKNVDGTINPNLQPERAMNYEINAKGNLFKSRLNYDLAFFKLDMEGELIAQSVQQGITIYNNAGKTNHNGVELALSYQVLQAADERFITNLRPYAALTYSDFSFKEYHVLNGQNEVTAKYDGNALTGVAPWVINAGLDIETKIGIYFYSSFLYSDKLPLNDANTDYNAAYHLLGAKAGYKTRVLKQLEINIYGGLDNLLDKSYSSIVSLNAVGYGGAAPAYYLPAPGRNGYGGISFKWLF